MEKVVRVVPRDDYSLELWFDTGDHRLFDARPYLNRGAFTRLQDITLFKQAFVSLDTVCWPGDLDIAPETLFDRSIPLDDRAIAQRGMRGDRKKYLAVLDQAPDVPADDEDRC